MIKKAWEFIKENVAAIVTVVTAVLTVVYAIIRLCIYVYWNGYFTRLHIDRSVMNINFDKSIFSVVFVSLVLLIVLFFESWAYEAITDIWKKAKERQLKGFKQIVNKVMTFFEAILLSFIILSMVNVSLIMLLTPLVKINISVTEMVVIFLVLYVLEMFFIVVQIVAGRRDKKREKISERDVVFTIIGILAMVLAVLSAAFYVGAQTIDRKTNVQLVEDEEYMISYCDGEHYVLHKVKYAEDEIIIYRNEQKIVGIIDCEYSIKKIEKVVINDN